MTFFVYMLKCITPNIKKSYVGYSKNVELRLKKHNSGKGAKFTRGRKWKIIYKKRYRNKSIAMQNEYKIKHNLKLRAKIKSDYLNKLK